MCVRIYIRVCACVCVCVCVSVGLSACVSVCMCVCVCVCARTRVRACVCFMAMAHSVDWTSISVQSKNNVSSLSQSFIIMLYFLFLLQTFFEHDVHCLYCNSLVDLGVCCGVVDLGTCWCGCRFARWRWSIACIATDWLTTVLTICTPTDWLTTVLTVYSQQTG